MVLWWATLNTCTNRTPDEWQCWCCPGRSSVRFDTATTTGRTNVPRLQHKLVCQCRVHAKRRKSASSNTSRATSNHKHPTTQHSPTTIHNPTLPHHPLPNQLFAVVDCNANKSNRFAPLSNDKSMVEETGSNNKMSSVTKKYPLCVSKHCFKCNSEREANTTPHSLHKRRMVYNGPISSLEGNTWCGGGGNGEGDGDGEGDGGRGRVDRGGVGGTDSGTEGGTDGGAMFSPCSPCSLYSFVALLR